MVPVEVAGGRLGMVRHDDARPLRDERLAVEAIGFSVEQG
jgi:hypothetical protein